MLNHKLLGSVSSLPSDANFENVTLLLSGDGTNGAQNNTFLDSSTNNFTITRNGNTTQGSFSPYGSNWSNYFTRASSQYLTAPNPSSQFSFGTGAFTIECWINPSSIPSGTGYPNSYWMFGGGDFNSDSGIDFYINNTQIGFNLTAFSSPTAIGNHGISVSQWYHVAVVRGGTSNQTISIYVNGSRVATASSVTASANAASSGIAIAAAEPSGATSGNFDGYISNYRVVKGTAVYDPTQTTLTVPTAPLTAITNTSLLTCQSNRFIDNSSNAFAITVNDTPSVQRFSPFNPTSTYSTSVIGGSGYFDGSGDYLTASNSSVFAVGTGDFTVEAWIYPLAFSAYRAVFDTRTTLTNGGMDFGLNGSSSGTWGLYKGSGVTVVQSNTNLTLNTWQHIAAVRSGSTVTLYLNGVSVGSATDSQNFSEQGCNIGRTFDNYAWNGYVTNLRFNNTAVYTSAFTPSTTPLTAISGTQLLLGMTNAGIPDLAMQNNLETVGNAQVSTSVKKYGTGSLAFDGTGDWLILPDTPNLRLGTGNFTIEFWVYLASGDTGSARGLIGKGGASTGWLISLDSSQKVVFTYTSSTITSSGAITTNAWNHIAVVREGTGSNQTKIYISGTNDGTGTVSTDFTQTEVMYIGANRTGGDPMKGNIDDLRLTRGIARYTTTFTPPAPLPTF